MPRQLFYAGLLGDVPLRLRYPRLYEVSKNKLLIVAQMFVLGWGDGE